VRVTQQEHDESEREEVTQTGETEKTGWAGW
jgi:hypothetical protein